MKLFTWFLLSTFTTLSFAHEDGFLSHNAHTIYHALLWILVVSIVVRTCFWIKARLNR
jgi:hypothetical protein